MNHSEVTMLTLFGPLWAAFALSLLAQQAAMDLHCHEPGVGGFLSGSHKTSDKKFLVVSGNGAGIGNFLVFFPAAYYFAVLTGREILIQDDSLLGEMCHALHCGFPHYDQIARAFPTILDHQKLAKIRGVKVHDMHRYFNGEVKMDEQLLRGDGFMEMSGWYGDYPEAAKCVQRITGCKSGDFSCHDRHALQLLVRGPFKEAFVPEVERTIIGVPASYKHGILTLPHVYAPRLDAAVHLRCQFQHFEWLVGKDDTAWSAAVSEVDSWLSSSDADKGVQLFAVLEAKIMAELGVIKAARDREAQRRRRRLEVGQRQRQRRLEGGERSGGDGHRGSRDSRDSRESRGRQLDKSHTQRHTQNIYRHIQRQLQALNQTQLAASLDAAHELESPEGGGVGGGVGGDGGTRIYVYVAADDGRVKEAFAEYLLGHQNISLMRVRTHDIIVHAKSTEYLKRTKDGVAALVVDWYSLSLANVLFAWRRETSLPSTYARSAMKVSGNIMQEYEQPLGGGEGKEMPTETHTKLFRLSFGHGRGVWNE